MIRLLLSIVISRGLDHPNIVKLKGVVYEVGKSSRESPRLFLEFEYLERDLRKYMYVIGVDWNRCCDIRKTFESRRMPIETIRSVIFQLIDGLEYCHSQRVVSHRLIGVTQFVGKYDRN